MPEMSRTRRQGVSAGPGLDFLSFSPYLGETPTTSQKQDNFDLLQTAVLTAHANFLPLIIRSPWRVSDQDNANQDFRYIFESKYDVVEQATGSYPGTQIQSTTVINLPNAVHPQRLRVILVGNDGGNAGMLPSKVLKYDGSSPFNADTFRASGTITDGLCTQITLSTALATGDVIIVRAGIFVPAGTEITGDSRMGAQLLFSGCSGFIHGNDYSAGVTGTTLLDLTTSTSDMIFKNLRLRGDDSNSTILHDHNFAMSFNSGNLVTIFDCTYDNFSIGRHLKAPAQGWTVINEAITYNFTNNRAARTPAFGEWIENNAQAMRLVRCQRYGEISVSDSDKMTRGLANDGSSNTGGDAFHGGDLFGQQNFGGQWGSSHAGVGQTRYYSIGNPLGNISGARILGRSQDIIVYYRHASTENWTLATHVAVSSLSDGVRDIDVTQEYGLRVWTGSLTVGDEIPPDADFRRHGDVLQDNDVIAVEVDLGTTPLAAAELRIEFAPTTWIDGVRFDGGSANYYEYQTGGSGRGLHMTGENVFEGNTVHVLYDQIHGEAVKAVDAVDNIFWVRQKNPFVGQRFNFSGTSARNSIMPFASRMPTQLKRTSGTQTVTGTTKTTLQFDSSATDLEYESEHECPRQIFLNLKSTVSNSSATGRHTTTITLQRDLNFSAGFVDFEEFTFSYDITATGTDYEISPPTATLFDDTIMNLYNVDLPKVKYRLRVQNSHADTSFKFVNTSALSVNEVDRA